MPKRLGEVAMTPAERMRRWRAMNPDRVREKEQERRHRLPEVYRAKYRRQYAANAEKRAKAAQARREADRDHYNAMVRARRAKDPTRNRAICGNWRARQSGGRVTALDIVKQMRAQQGRCYYCEQPTAERFEVDHFIALANGGKHDPSNIVIACPNCNRRKNKLNGSQFIAKLRGVA